MSFKKFATVLLILLTFACADSNPFNKGPVIRNDSSCDISVNIEKDCSVIVGDSYVAAGDSLILTSQDIEKNDQFCITLKPNCDNEANQDIQTVKVLFNSTCNIKYHEYCMNSAVRSLVISSECQNKEK